jgi:hypothetical protein
VLCFSLVAILALAGCNREGKQSSPGEQGDIPGAEKTEDRVYGIGEAARTDKLEITVTDQMKTRWRR